AGRGQVDLVAGRLAEVLPAAGGEVGGERAVDLVRPGRGRPVDGGDRAVGELEVVEAAGAVGRGRLVGGGVAEVGHAHVAPLLQDGAVDLVGAAEGGPVDD